MGEYSRHSKPGSENASVKWGIDLIFSKNQQRTDVDGTQRMMESVAGDEMGETGGGMM